MTDRELMRVVFKAIDSVNDFSSGSSYAGVFDYEVKLLRERLAQPEQKHSEQWWRHEVSNAYANGYEKGRASVKQPEQEPVAWADKYDLDRAGHDFWSSRQANVRTGVPLYTAPPQREWQGLTDEEIEKIEMSASSKLSAIYLAEAQLKGKNIG